MAFLTDTLHADRWEFDLPRTLYGAVCLHLKLARSRAALVELDARLLAEGAKGFWS